MSVTKQIDMLGSIYFLRWVILVKAQFHSERARRFIFQFWLREKISKSDSACNFLFFRLQCLHSLHKFSGYTQHPTYLHSSANWDFGNVGRLFRNFRLQLINEPLDRFDAVTGTPCKTPGAIRRNPSRWHHICPKMGIRPNKKAERGNMR